jgi:hypothetical protein
MRAADEEPLATLAINALRAGTVAETAIFLLDLDRAYRGLYFFDDWAEFIYFDRPLYPERYYGRGYYPFIASAAPDDFVLPSERLQLQRVEIHSPGIWEFLGGLNPIQQLREYLKDRHERRKDREYREAAEKERLQLENEHLLRDLMQKETSILQAQLSVMREFGIDEKELSHMVWSRIGAPLSDLNKHQDSGLIGRPIDPDEHKTRR